MGLYPIYVDLDAVKPNKQDIERKLAMLNIKARVYWRHSSHKNHYHLKIELLSGYGIGGLLFGNPNIDNFFETLVIRALLNDDAKRIASDLRRIALYPKDWYERVNRLFDYKIVKGKVLRAGRWHRLL